MTLDTIADLGRGQALSRYRMTTCIGRSLPILAPNPKDVTIEEIAHHLSRICRWGGAVREFYSVAQHSILVASLVSPGARKWALLHDASEYVLGDVVSDLKRWQGMDDYRALEALWQQVIYHRFNLHGEPPPEVKEADRLASIIEAQDLLPLIPVEFPPEYRDREVRRAIPTITPWDPARARANFLKAFERIGGQS